MDIMRGKGKQLRNVGVGLVFVEKVGKATHKTLLRITTLNNNRAGRMSHIEFLWELFRGGVSQRVFTRLTPLTTTLTNVQQYQKKRKKKKKKNWTIKTKMHDNAILTC